MIKKFPTIFFALVICTPLFAQVSKKRLPQNINVPTYSHIFPSLSGDGNQMIFLTNYTNSEGFEVRHTNTTGPEIWDDPKPLTSINRPGMDHIGSFCLSYDGNFVVFASRRTPTIGNFDIWISEKTGNNWSQPVNPGKPLNSAGHEGNPSLSPDGKTIYFMRCESMDNTNKSKCAIYFSSRLTATRWSEPERLPDHINTGHEVTPRIMADNKTLLFASGRAGGLGKLDLYQTVLDNGKWSTPEPLSFINTPENDEYISVPARGDIIYYTESYRDKYNIFKAMIPEQFRPNKVLMLTGSVKYNDGKNASDDVLIQAFDTKSGELFTSTRLRHDNGFTIFLPEGAAYDVSVFPQKGGHTYYSQIFDLLEMPFSRKEQMDITLNSVQPGRSIVLPTIRFEPYSSKMIADAEIEVKRIVGFLKKNPEIRIEIGAYMDQIYSDSIPSADLTEVIGDTTFCRIQKDTGSHEEKWSNETQEASPNVAPQDGMGEDSLFTDEAVILPDYVSPTDSLLALDFELYDETEDEWIYYKISNVYHNNRTQKQAESLVHRLVEAGVPASMLEAKGYGDDWSEDLATEERSYWIELKILSQ
jgi:hypothetical protein